MIYIGLYAAGSKFMLGELLIVIDSNKCTTTYHKTDTYKKKTPSRIHSWRNEKMQWMTALSCMWQMYLSSIITNVWTHLMLFIQNPNEKSTYEKECWTNETICMHGTTGKNAKERKTSSTLLKYLNYACSARRTHYAVCQFRCIVLSCFLVVVVVAGRCQDASEWKTPHLMEFHCMSDANTFSRMWMRIRVDAWCTCKQMMLWIGNARRENTMAQKERNREIKMKCKNREATKNNLIEITCFGESTESSKGQASSTTTRNCSSNSALALHQTYTKRANKFPHKR